MYIFRIAWGAPMLALGFQIAIFFNKSEKYMSVIVINMPQPSCMCTVLLKLA